MATYVWFVPGFMGSTLGLYPASGGVKAGGQRIASLWGGLAAIPRLPLVSILSLPSTLSPTQTIVADGLAPSLLGGYTNFAQALASILPSGWVYSSWPYDWRLSASVLGPQLAAALLTTYRAGNTNIVIGHSYGALVAWMAWASLVDQVQTPAMSRFLTFGGALYGASATPGIFLEKEESLNQLVLLQQLVVGNTVGALATQFGGPTDAQVAQLLTLASTWPAVYDLYPDYGTADDPGDTLRGNAFLSSYWTNALVQPNWALLTAEVAAVHTYLRQAKYLPPPAMSANIFSAAYHTPYRVQSAQALTHPVGAALPPAVRASAKLRRLWNLPSWSDTILGDGRCTVYQASWPGHYFSQVSSPHATMQTDPAVLVAIEAMLTMTFPLPVVPASGGVAPAYNPPPAATFLTDTGRRQLANELIPPALLEGIVVPQPQTFAPAPVVPIHVGGDP